MLEIHCSGTPYEIGLQHGRAAAPQISGTINFYAGLFRDNAKLDWPAVTKTAMDFEPVIKKKWPAYWEEMQGVADGADKTLADIIAINVRTEINFGLFTDGCTALSWKTSGGKSWLAQNWDWQEAQKPNIVVLHIEQEGKPSIKMVSEAGLIGKIGLNSKGVGICLNAIRAKGMDITRIPCHLGLRLALESESKEEAVAKLEKYDVASACHYLLADAKDGGIGIEWSSVDGKKIEMDTQGRVFHSNHYVKTHGIKENQILADSKDRIKRIEELSNELKEDELNFDNVFNIFKDEQGLPGAICRYEAPPTTTSATLFNIVMELQEKKAMVTMGRPVAPGERVELAF
ncbi:isopenicillin-N N-acyltransferase [Rhizodiscina lignyota]|uniref:Isopenicillin-N N-acyltransferase n=1 Tax=Rhizodiscina lignyota TaxID=1504668 RepID=A0A9P4I467_9PEZI|nr:isopenicillin-N N-acyltransferase [Rhizodiscina lignyota]